MRQIILWVVQFVHTAGAPEVDEMKSRSQITQLLKHSTIGKKHIGKK